jgi:outer membrane protein OmpA-like peptidoglycan-associated protein
MRIRFTVLILASLTTGAPRSHAQGAAPPRTYSISELNNMMVPDLTVKLYRDGTKELVEQSRPKSADAPKGYRMRTLYDFQAHKLYTWDLVETSSPCGIQDITETEAPEAFDVITGAARMAGEIAKRRPKTVVTETVAGGPAWIFETPDQAGRGTIKQWLTVKGDYLVKSALVPKSGPVEVMLEVTELSFEKPSASWFVLPPICAKSTAGATPVSASPPPPSPASSSTAGQVSDADANALPPGLMPPAGFQIEGKNSKHFDFFHVEIGYLKGGAMTHIDPAGRTWMPFMKLANPNKTGVETDQQMRASLASQGWELLSQSGLLIAHKTQQGKEMWFSGAAFSGDYRAVIVEVGPAPHSLTLAAPAPTPEAIADGSDFPYLQSFPGSKLIRTAQEPGRTFNAAMPGRPEELVGQPLVRKFYQLPASVSTYEFVAVYRDALAKAGWQIIRTAAASDAQVIAHWTRNGRDIFVYLAGDAYAVADVGAQNEAKKLAADLARDGHVAIYGIYFDVDQATLKPESEVALQHVLDLLKSDASLKLEVQGHTDNTGSAPHNQTLSEQRAASVSAWLVGHGVSAGRLTAKGYGDTQPAADNRTPEGRAKNRRVELKKS